MGDEFQKSINRITKDLKIPKSFLNSLLKEDDWSFVIKSHFLLEGALSFLLTKATRKEELHETFVVMDMNKKIEAAKAIGLIDSNHRKFIRALSNLRNKLVHRVTSVSFSFEEYLADKKQRKSFIDNFGLWKEEFIVGGKNVTRSKFTVENPKLTIFVGVLYVLAEVDLVKQEVELEIDKESFIRRKSELLESLLNLSLVNKK